jgi:hypothetical protein
MMAMAASNSNDLFISHEMEKGGQGFVDLTIGVQLLWGIMQITLTLFKFLTNFTLKD